MQWNHGHLLRQLTIGVAGAAALVAACGPSDTGGAKPPSAFEAAAAKSAPAAAAAPSAPAADVSTAGSASAATGKLDVVYYYLPG